MIGYVLKKKRVQYDEILVPDIIAELWIAYPTSMCCLSEKANLLIAKSKPRMVLYDKELKKLWTHQHNEILQTASEC